MHEHVTIHILLNLLWDYVHTAVCEKCLVCIEESVLLQVVCTGPTHLCVAHFELHKKKKVHRFFCFGVVRLGGCLERRGSMFQEVGGLHGVSEGGGVI